jgi:hypothetical protein
MKKFGLLSMAVVAGTAASALAQDSVSVNAGIPGDALEASSTTAGYQRAAYVVDMTRLFGSWGTRFGIAPIAKTSSYDQNFRAGGFPVFNALGSTQTLSQTLLQNQSPATSQYRLWEDTAGAGAHPVNNSGGSLVSPSGASFSQFGAAISEFATDVAGRSYNGIVSTVVNFDPADPSRLYVLRTQAAVNLPNGSGGDTSQFGLGAIDSRGNVTFRADSFQSTGTPALQGNNYFRVRSLTTGAFAARNASVINQINNNGAADAASTDWVVVRSGTTHNTPNMIPSDRASDPRGVTIGSNFATNYVHEASPLSITATAAHRPGTADHRGGVAYSALRLRGSNTVGTGAMITKASSASGQPSESISVWGLSSNGTPVNAVTVAVPRGTGATLADPTPEAPYAWDLGTGDFRHYSGAVAARGGNGQVSMGLDQAGNGLLAANVYGVQSVNSSGLPNEESPHNAIAVYRFNPNQPTTGSWIVAAWTNPAGAFTDSSGKAIYGDNGNDGAPFTNDPGEFDDVLDLNPLSPTYDAPIGHMTAIFEVNGSILGPSISAPTFDSAGNIYFISAVRLKKANGFIDTDSALIRAVYDRQNFCYRLELLMELGDTFLGQNSGVRYQVQFMNIATTSNRASPGTLWSNNGASYGWNNTDPTSIDSQDPKALGGLVLTASVVYDVDRDSDYQNPASNPGSLDEQYNVLLYIGNMDAPEVPTCPADFNGDGFLDFFDYDDYVNCFETGTCPPGKTADFNGDDFVDFFDYDDFVFNFETGC